MDFIHKSNWRIKLWYWGNNDNFWDFNLVTLTLTFYFQIIASCTFNFLPNFEVLDLNSTHPSLRVLQGQPIASEYIILVTKNCLNKNLFQLPRHTSGQKWQLSTCKEFRRLMRFPWLLHKELFFTAIPSTCQKDQRKFLHCQPLSSGFQQSPFILSSKEQTVVRETASTLTEWIMSFQNLFSGGNVFKRLSKTLFTPASTSVEVTATSSRIEAAPGESTSAEFIVTNFGEPATVSMTVNDDLGFFVSADPEQ